MGEMVRVRLTVRWRGEWRTYEVEADREELRDLSELVREVLRQAEEKERGDADGDGDE